MKSASIGRMVFGGAAAWLWVGVAGAHHAPAIFDLTKEVVIEGNVTEFRWQNPHSWIHLDVKDDKGQVNNWTIEMNPPTYLVRGGWRRTSVKAGDHVKVTINPLKVRDQYSGKFVSIVLPDGTVLGEQAAVLGEGTADKK